MSFYRDERDRRSRPPTGLIIGVIVALAVIGGLFWLIIGWWQDADDRFWQWLTESFWGRGFWPEGWNVMGASPTTFLLVGLLIAGVALYIWVSVNDERHSTTSYIACGLAALMVVVSSVVWFSSRDNRAQYYGTDTTFIVPDKDELSTNLQRLNGKYIDEGDFAQEWEPRVASATGAKTVMKRTSASDSGNQLLLDTLTYTYGEEPGWTAIRDGKKKQPLYGVAFWPGEGDVQTCRFTGQHNMTKALNGKQGNSLLDEIAAYDKSLFFDEQDMWGYCDDDKPVLVIPVKQWDGNGNRAVWQSAGVLTITGSSSGKAQIEHIKDVTSGQFPGPVYPVSLAADQRQETQWMAGQWNKWFRDFGYETTDVESQAGNSSEFLLKSVSDGHLYWVTPLTARGSDSQLITAYSLVRADKATSGTFNATSIYVLDNEDPRVVNLDDLEARVKQAISEENPGFFSAKGKVVEFLPLDDENWQAYAELGGRVVYRITVPTDSRVRPEVTSLDSIDETPDTTDPNSPQGETSAGGCAADLSLLSNQELAQCLSDVADELSRR